MLDSLLYQRTIVKVLLAMCRYLSQNSGPKLFAKRLENIFPEVIYSRLSQLHVTKVLEVEPIEVLKDASQVKRSERVVLPVIEVFFQELFRANQIIERVLCSLDSQLNLAHVDFKQIF